VFVPRNVLVYLIFSSKAGVHPRGALSAVIILALKNYLGPTL
jgi:hypothetical protein